MEQTDNRGANESGTGEQQVEETETETETEQEVEETPAENTEGAEAESSTGGVQSDIQGNGEQLNSSGKRTDGDGISTGQTKQSVDDGNNEQGGLLLWNNGDRESETGKQDVSEEVGRRELHQPANGTTNNRGTDRTGNANLSEAIRKANGEEAHIADKISNDTEAKKIATETILEALTSAGIKWYKATAKQIKSALNAIGVEAQIVFHGSGNKFLKFNHSYMGAGEGSQAYGWGSYVSQIKGIGESYAVSAARRGKAMVSLNGNDITKSIPQNITLDNTPLEYVEYVIMVKGKDARSFISDNLDICKSRLKNEANNTEQIEKIIGLLNEALEIYDNNNWEYSEPAPRLYTVEIPDDNGKNYLPWDDVISEERLSEIINKIFDVVKDDSAFDWDSFTSYIEKRSDVYNVTGQDIYNLTMRFCSERIAGAKKKASDILSKAGFTGISVPAQFRTGGRADGAKNYVIFNENDLQIQSSIELMQTPNGIVYGWTKDGEIYLTENGFNPESPVHEYTHIWANAMRQKNLKGWESIKNLLKDTPIWNDVVNDSNYQNIKDNEDAIASEALSRISGKENAAKL